MPYHRLLPFFFLLLALVFAPARLLGLGLEMLSSGHLGLSDASGGFWQGRGRLWVRLQPDLPARALTEMSWQWRWAMIDIASAQGHLAVQFDTLPGWRMKGNGLLFPATALGALAESSGLPTDGWLGQLRLDELRLNWGINGQLLAMEMDGRWLGAGNQRVAATALGDYSLQLMHAASHPCRVAVQTLGGVVGISGEWPCRDGGSGSKHLQISVGDELGAAQRLRLESLLRYWQQAS